MRITAKEIYEKKRKKEKITALTAYDFLFAKILDRAGLDVILVGDSVGMTMLGLESTIPVTMREMLHHCRAVSRAVRKSLLVADMPFGSFDGPERALRNARRFLKEAGTDAVKLEGGRKVEHEVRALIAAGIPVMGHVGMTPQSAGMLGGYRVQGRDEKSSAAILDDAKLLDGLGVFSIVLECIPRALAAEITRAVKCPTIGIGAGAETDGQILVLPDMLGFQGAVKPRFVRAYASLEGEVEKAVSRYRDDVIQGKFPEERESY